VRRIRHWKLCLALALCASCYRSGPQEAPQALQIARGERAPFFPHLLHGANVEGDVELVLLVDSSGVPDMSRVRIIRSSHDLFSSSVSAAMSQWRFAPARRGGRAVADSVRVRWEFALPENCARAAFPGNVWVDSTAVLGPQYATRPELTASGISGKTSACLVESRNGWVGAGD
jgi:TonB family protein